jgi:hypothetical protein
VWNNVCKTFGINEGSAHMNSKPDYDSLYEIAERQAGYFTAHQAGKARFSIDEVRYPLIKL